MTSPFTLIQGPHSCSSPLWWLVLLWSDLEYHIHPCFIYICNFRLRVYTFLLVFFDSLAGKAFLARSIKLCLVDNQRSSGVVVAGFESCWFEARSSTSRSPPIERTLTSRKIGSSPHQVVSRFQVAREVLSCFPSLDSFVFSTYSLQKSLKKCVSAVL